MSSCIIPAGSDAPPANRSSTRSTAPLFGLTGATEENRVPEGKQEAFCGTPGCFLWGGNYSVEVSRL